jgi:hypothetical protein
MPRWSRQQDEYLTEHCNEGAEAVADGMRVRFGISRTPGAVQRHASRIGLSCYVYEICPSCGGKYDHLERCGVCHQCRQLELAEYERTVKRDSILAEIRANQSRAERRKAEREYEKERKRNSVLRRKHGIPAVR